MLGPGEAMKAPFIQVPPPGPRAREIVERDSRYLATSTKTLPLVVKKAKGSVVEDVDGNRYIDFTCGVGVTNLGHVNEDVLEAVEAQLGDMWHFAGTDFYYQVQVDLAETLARLAPGDSPKKVFFTNSGTESIEAAIKLARWNRQGKHFLAFLNAFHGRTMGSLALTASKGVQRERFFPMMPGVKHVPYAYCYRCPYHLTYPECDLWCARIIEESYLKTLVPPKELAALFFEPVQGEGGYILPPPGWAKEVERIARENDILLIADEVQTGIGRTGAMFAVEHTGTVPDAIAIAKGLGSGFPIGALILDARLDFGVQGAHSNTFGGNAVACAAALATLGTIEKEGLHKRALVMGDRMHDRLEEMRQRWPIMGDNRGIGLMRATELVAHAGTKEPAIKERDALLEEAFRRGLVLLPCGESAVRYIPALTIEEELLDKGLDILEESIKAVSRSA
ncbi:MAG: acetyl ornithine aminotransferase family protein [Thermoplasmata archaeon]